MSIIRPQKLGIIAGPGSEYFTRKIVNHLHDLYDQRNEKMIDALSQKYSTSTDTITRHISFMEDLSYPEIPSTDGEVNLRLPNFRIDVKYTRFKNGEVKTEILSPVRGMSVYMVYDMSVHTEIQVGDTRFTPTINDHMMFLFTTVQAVMMSGAGSITLVLPTYPYARQHKKTTREGLTAALVGKILEDMGVTRIITLDIHSREIENAFSRLHLENLHASYECIGALDKVLDISSNDLVVVSPDTGAVARNKFYANALHCPLAMLYKERDYSKLSLDAKHSNIKSINLLGDVKDKHVIIADDMIATGGTLITAMRELKKKGAKTITSIVSLPFFNGSAPEDFDAANKEGVFEHIIGTNAVFQNERLLSKDWFVQADISELFAKVIMRLHHRRPISPLLDNRTFVQNLINKKQQNKNKEN